MSYIDIAELFKTLDTAKIVVFPYEKYCEYTIAFKPCEPSMNVGLCDLAGALGVNRSDYKDALPVMDKFGKELAKRFNTYREIIQENEKLKNERNLIAKFFSGVDIVKFNEYKAEIAKRNKTVLSPDEQQPEPLTAGMMLKEGGE